MSKKNILLAVARISVISLLISVAVLFLNVWLFSSSKHYAPIEMLFIEGVLFIIGGVLLLLGRGGINLWSLKAIVLSALAEALYDTDTVGPSEILRHDKWKPQGFVRLALVLIVSGVFMILIYFINMALSP